MMDIKNLAKALMEAEAEMEPLKATTDNTYFKSKYPDLASVYAVIRGPLTRHGVVILQGVSNSPETGVVTVDCTLLHIESGEFRTDTLPLTPKDNSPQSIGSVITYARRYLLLTMLNLAPEDDDGAEASQGRPQPQRQPERQPEPPLPAKPTNGKPNSKPEEVRKAAIAFAMTQQTGSYRSQEHAENTYDKLSDAHPDMSLADIKRMWIEITEAHKLLKLIDAKAKFPEEAYKRDLAGLKALVAYLKRQVRNVEDTPFDDDAPTDAEIEDEMAVVEARAAA
jgi:hypothetical protein